MDVRLGADAMKLSPFGRLTDIAIRQIGPAEFAVYVKHLSLSLSLFVLRKYSVLVTSDLSVNKIIISRVNFISKSVEAF